MVNVEKGNALAGGFRQFENTRSSILTAPSVAGTIRKIESPLKMEPNKWLKKEQMSNVVH